ncbi:helix-turn-helix domain-containing protein [Undibacterium crateris]|uniref:helix-turn-helix domain-containing protein n=1 Tax=Undibacterium crateris TaxID=2528175 RepID=UPI001389A15B|nr:helix-turn-helix domain-containing protein [Undibacterium crateris]NDI85125.1 helix-turn-helix domain-containing protein [Undibacterium crateris]
MNLLLFCWLANLRARSPIAPALASIKIHICIFLITMSDSLNIRQCADLLHVNESTVSEMAISGEIPGAKIGRAWVFLKEDVISYLRNEISKQTAVRKKEADEKKPKEKFPESSLVMIKGAPKVSRKRVLPDLSAYQN